MPAESSPPAPFEPKPLATAAEIATRFAALSERLRQLSPTPVEILPVTKGFGPALIDRAVEAGLTSFGENYAPDLVAKAHHLDQTVHQDADWHFIGRLQSNKIRSLAPHVSVWQSVDRIKLGRRIAEQIRAGEARSGTRVFVQMRPASVSEDKGGCPAELVPQLVEQLRSLDLAVTGIMCVGVQADTDGTAAAFAEARRLGDELDLPERSFGMSQDIEIAVAHGTTMIRVGTALFGPRPPLAPAPST